MHRLKELKIWNKAISLATEVYKTTAGFPNEEKYGLISQIRRATVSISSNIAEGAGRNSSNEFLHFLGIANGSCYELQSQLVIAEQLQFISQEKLDLFLNEIEEIQKMNFKLQQSIKQLHSKPETILNT
jgi:four helix bundle protein